MTDSSTARVDIHVDPACPWAWLTWNWLDEVASVRPVTVRTRLLCLAEVNRGEEGRAKESHEAGERALRVLAQARVEQGDPALARLYREICESYHERNEPLGDPDVTAACAVAAGLDAGIVARALDADGSAEALTADHREAVDAGGFGVPTLRLDGGPGFFGPIVDRRITGEDAGRLWDCVAPLLRHPHLFELKRTRTSRAQTGRSARAAAARESAATRS